MKRRDFVVASGSAILTGSVANRVNQPSLALEFELSQVPNQSPSELDSVLIGFSTFSLTPRYLDENKDLQIKATLNIEGGYNSESEASVKPQNGVRNNLANRIGNLEVNGIESSANVLSATVEISVEQDSFSKTYTDSFNISGSTFPETNGGVSDNIIIGDTEYKRHVFKSDDQFKVSSDATIDVLVVGGGGGGSAGGGGAGGLVYKSDITVSNGRYNVIVGSGGSRGARPYNSGKGGNGGDSYFDKNGSEELRAIGGGGGGDQKGGGKDGGSGGGTGTNAGVEGGSALQPNTNPTADIDAGNKGGFAPNTTNPNSTGGGGGAGQEGQDAERFDKPGDGGDGLDLGGKVGSDIGDGGNFAGGSAGGGTNCLDNGSPQYYADGGLGGGANGGGDCGSAPIPDPPIDNTGAGGRHGTQTTFQPTSGSDGIVVIRVRPK